MTHPYCVMNQPPDPGVFCCPIIELNTANGNTTGHLSFHSDMTILHEIVVHGALTSPGSIDFNGHNVSGAVELLKGGNGQLQEGGRVTDSGRLSLSPSSTYPYNGKASFQALENLPNVLGGGVIEAAAVGGGIDISGDVSGAVNVGTILKKGAVTCEGDLTGTISVENNCEGAISVNGSIDSTGVVNVRGNLTSSGRVVVEGPCHGQVSVFGQADKLSTIQLLSGLYTDGNVTINAAMSNGNENGTIHVGPALFAPGTPVTFDGSVRIRGGDHGGGDLNGLIEVVGCHATSDRLDICVCGAINGSVKIKQDGCPNQVGWTCQSGCP